MTCQMLGDHPNLLMYWESYWHAVMFNRYGTRLVPGAELLDVLRQTVFPGNPGPVIFEVTLGRYGVDPGSVYDQFLGRWGNTSFTVADFSDRLTDIVLARTGKTSYGDKTPHYCFHMHALQTLWPDLVFVNVVRHGVAVARSMQHHLGFQILAKLGIDDWSMVARTHTALTVPDRDIPLDAYLDMWARQMLRTRDEATRLRPGSYLEVRYEELLTAPARVLTAVCDFAGLRPDPAWIERQVALVRPERLTKGGRPEPVPPLAAGVLDLLGYDFRDPAPAVRLAA